MTKSTKLNQSTSSKKEASTELSKLFGRKPPRFLSQLANAGIKKIEDLLWIFPYRFEVVPRLNSFAYASPGAKFIGIGKIYHVDKKPNRGFKKGNLSNATIRVLDQFNQDQNTLDLQFFNLYPSQLTRLAEANVILFYGEVGLFNGRKQIVNPEIISTDPTEEEIHILKKRSESLKPIYPTLNKVKPEQIRQVISLIPEQYWDQIPELVPANLLEKRNLLGYKKSLQILHAMVDATPEEKIRARDTLIYFEFFIEQIKLLVRRSIIRNKKIKPIKISQEQIEKCFKLFPFELTDDQKKVIQEISIDLDKAYSMMRLVQGDVGSGKTAVAIAIAFLLARNGYQFAYMCPTESLAQQHMESFFQILEPLGIKCHLITGQLKGKKRNEFLERLKSGEISVAIGTHALIVDDVKFKNLGMTVIDEQHKFGVEQRLKLTAKSKTEHCLIMTATPIPRSLSLSFYGDLDLSIIKSMPAQRKGIKSRIVTGETFQQFLSFLKTRIEMGEQAFIVVPAIEESEAMDMTNLNHSLERFAQYFPDLQLAGLHGKMKSDEKSEIVKRFSNKEIQILIATSVVEVGINIPNASVMAVLNPERFGLSSLHQLRGRVGRGDRPGFFFMVVDKKISQDSLERLKIIEETTDGFKIAESDLEIRGEGDLLGREQSGVGNQRRIANIVEHSSFLEMAREDATQLFETNQQFVQQSVQQYSNDPIVRLTI